MTKTVQRAGAVKSGSPESRVTIVLPVYNGEKYLPSALDSVFAQTYACIELIVVDDGSTDATPDILADYQRRYSFRIIRQTNQKLPRALNAGFAASTGEYLTWTSADNLLAPDMISTLAKALTDNPDIGLVYSDRRIIDENGDDLGRFNAPDYDRHLLLHTNLVHCSFLYRRSCREQVGDYDPDFVYGEDWEYWIRISRNFKMERLPLALYYYRVHAASMTGEIVRGTARSLSFQTFAARIRARMPLRWFVGKAKWLMLRLVWPQHPAVSGTGRWKVMLSQQIRAPQSPIKVQAQE